MSQRLTQRPALWVFYCGAVKVTAVAIRSSLAAVSQPKYSEAMSTDFIPHKERRGMKLIFRPYFWKNGKIHFPKKSRVFPMWIPAKD